MERPFAAFDIDGTLIRWQLYHALADDLAHSGKIDKQRFDAVKQDRMTWKKRADVNSFKEYEGSLVSLVDSTLSTIKVEDLEAASHRVFDEYKDQVYTFTRDLLTKLKQENYLLFAVSASQSQIVGMVASYYGFDDYRGSEYEVKNGYFTGKKELLLGDQKPIKLRELADKHQAIWGGSIAVGDSESDIPMLSEVERPIAFNPNRTLFEHARKQGWSIVVERKNVVYELGPNDGSYLLG